MTGNTMTAIGVLAGVALASRLAGPSVATLLARSPRVERALDGAAQATLGALVAAALAQGGWREAAAAAVAALIAVSGGGALGGLAAGALLAALWRLATA